MLLPGSPLPTCLYVPGQLDSIPLPVTPPRTDELPLGDLSFENLQRLSVRLLAKSTDTIHCQEYGVPGQKQEGIDLYARLAGKSKMEVCQCKRYNSFRAADIDDAVEEFLNGGLVERTDQFVIVTSAKTEPKQLADAELAASDRLRAHGIQFQLKGCVQLTTLLI